MAAQSARPSRRPSGSGRPARTSFTGSSGSRDSGSRPSSGGRSFSSGGSRPSSGGRSFSSAPGSRSSSGRPSSGGFSRRPSSGGFAGGGRRRPVRKGSTLNISSFINKAAVVTEETEHFRPEHMFSDFAVDPRLAEAVRARGYEQPTPIQDKTMPHTLKGRDVVGLANTGTGKTAAFLIPLIDKVLKNPEEKVIIMAPTRELALQIEQEFRGFTPRMGLFSVICVGGMPLGPQIGRLRTNPRFIIGTPGRIMDLMERRALDLSGVRSVVLDEADRMLDMGFVNDMRFVMKHMPKPRHTLFFSATMSPSIENLIGEFLNDPVRISVKTQDTAKNIDQDVVSVRGMEKIAVLHDLLLDPAFTRVLIFGRTKHGVEKLAKELKIRGFSAESIHGNKSHGQRQTSLKRFKEGQAKILVATDVAARGLDIDKVTHVINYELPETYDDYVHRIGRTGRGVHKGKALTFID